MLVKTEAPEFWVGGEAGRGVMADNNRFNKVDINLDWMGFRVQ
jgi:hypothetical protein